MPVLFSAQHYDAVSEPPIDENQVTLVPVFQPAGQNDHLMLTGALKRQAHLHKFTAAVGQSMLTSVPDGPTLVHFGLGKRSDFNIKVWRTALLKAVTEIQCLETESFALNLPTDLVGIAPVFGITTLREVGFATALTIANALHKPKTYKTGVWKIDETSVCIQCAGLRSQPELLRALFIGIRQGSAAGRAVSVARDTANEPPNICTPTYLADLARVIAFRSAGKIKTTVFDRAECLKRGMNAFLAVAGGSGETPQFIVMEYTPSNLSEGGPVLALVGKGVTFDSGGLNLKQNMRDMKFDMCGAADVIAAIEVIAELRLPIRVKAFCAATENGTGDNAYHPGDVIKGRDGKTYEIGNTDAEGRLTLVDAIAAARLDWGVTHVISIATLTGAIIQTFGNIAAGLFSEHQEFADLCLASAASSGELAFQLPVGEEFAQLNGSSIADLSNNGGPGAGSIAAARFVLSAAGKLPAVHFDIAGVAWTSAGATGWGVATLVEVARRLSASGDQPSA